jgi:predicted amidohydrolase YtcJ
MEHLKSPTQFECLIVMVSVAIIFSSCSMPKTNVDLLITNGNFYTLDERMPEAQAVAVKNGRIAAIGTNREINSQFVGKNSLDLRGAFVLPGLIDGHGHMSKLGFSLTTLDLRGVKSPDEAAKFVQDAASKSVSGGWIRGSGWNQELWNTKSFPTHEVLDKVAPDNYVFLVRVDEHAVWVNQKVIEFAGITRTTKDPAGGKIVRDKYGDPTGVFLDSAINLITSKMPPPTDAEVENAILLAADTCARYGLTEVQDAGIDAQTLRVYRKLADQRKLKIRIYAMYLGTDSTLPEILKQGPIMDGDSHFTMRSVKVYMDGALGSRGAALVQAYSDDPGNYGLTEMSEKDLENLTIAALFDGFQVCTHAIGDRANDIVLNAYEAAMKIAEVTDPRLRIEHAQVLLKEDISRFKTLGVIPSMQPTHCTSDMSWVETRLGPERIKYAYAWQSLLKDGSIIVGGSDFPVESPDPRLGIYAAVTRRDLFGLPRDFKDVKEYFEVTPDIAVDSSDFSGGFFPQQRMTMEQAIKAFTLWPAYGAFEDNDKGTISVGKYADFTIFRDDIREIPASQIPSDEILGTIVGGKPVYVSPTWNSGKIE